jgi:hypothetical protein
MTRRDITSTDPQGSRSGPRPDQLPHAAPDPDAPATTADVDNEVDEDDDPVADVDDLGAAVEGDGDRPVDATRGKRHVRSQP